MEKFSVRLATAMELRNIKPIELSQKTKITKSSISQYLSGVNEPRTNKLSILAKVLDVNEAWLMGYDVATERSETKHVFNLLKDDCILDGIILSEQEKEHMVNYIRFLRSQSK